MFSTRILGTMIIVALVAPMANRVRARSGNADVVFEWNQVLQDTTRTAPPPLTPRYYAMMHIAMFDAINAIERDYISYHVRLRHPAGGSPEAAAAQAAHDVLVAINPAATSTYASCWHAR